MATGVQNEPTMQYGHMMPERRDSNLDTNGSVRPSLPDPSRPHLPQTPFQSHPGLGQALGTHLPGPPAYSRGPESYRNSSPNLPHIGPQSQPHPGASSSPLFAVPPSQASPGIKRKQVDTVINAQVPKRRRDGEDNNAATDYDLDSSGQGAKHWTDEEKSKLFTWLMGPGQDDHWNSLRATKNSCLRECSLEVFGNKKTYQALKGCYERNFNLFKQIYAFESFHGHSLGSIAGLPEADRLREYERRLQAARKAGCDVGNITARTIDHWYRVGWYDLFYRRWHGDPATTRPAQSRTNGQVPSSSATVEEGDGEDDQPSIDYAPPDHVQMPNGINGLAHDRPPNMNYFNAQNIRDIPPLTTSPSSAAGGPTQPNPPPTSTSNASASDPTLVNIPVTHGLLHAYLQTLQVQTQTNKMKLELLRRREEREERESAQRREIERLKLEREAAEFEHNKQSTIIKQKADRAIELLGNPSADPSLKQAAGDYLKRLFMD